MSDEQHPPEAPPALLDYAAKSPAWPWRLRMRGADIYALASFLSFLALLSLAVALVPSELDDQDGYVGPVIPAGILAIGGGMVTVVSGYIVAVIVHFRCESRRRSRIRRGRWAFAMAGAMHSAVVLAGWRFLPEFLGEMKALARLSHFARRKIFLRLVFLDAALPARLGVPKMP